MGVRREGYSRGYEEMTGTNIPPNSTNNTHLSNNGDLAPALGPEFELSSVTVIPDGKIFTLI